jgi:hypothetical protein
MFKFELYEGNISARNLKQTTYNTDVSLAVDGIYSQEIEFEGISYNQDDLISIEMMKQLKPII